MNCSGMARSSFAANSCDVKQKHSIFLKCSTADVGATLGTACATLSCPVILSAVKVAKYIFPGCTTMLSTSALRANGACELTVVTNSTVMLRSRSGASFAATATLFVRPAKPVTSQNASYKGTSKKPKANIPAVINNNRPISDRFDKRGMSCSFFGEESIVLRYARSTPIKINPR